MDGARAAAEVGFIRRDGAKVAAEVGFVRRDGARAAAEVGFIRMDAKKGAAEVGFIRRDGAKVAAEVDFIRMDGTTRRSTRCRGARAPASSPASPASGAPLARFLDTHAAAEAACGDIARAAQLQQEAVGLLPAGDQWKEDRAAFQQRLQKYLGK